MEDFFEEQLNEFKWPRWCERLDLSAFPPTPRAALGDILAGYFKDSRDGKEVYAASYVTALERKAQAWDEVIAIVRAGGIYFHCYERIESLVESFDKEAADGK